MKVEQYTGEDGEKLTLRGGSAKRDSKEAATITFSANAPGNYYYALYNQKQTNPVVVTTSANTNTGTMAESNTITVNDMTDCKAKYLYVVGVDAAGVASDPLEIVIPSKTFELKHEKQGLLGISSIEKDGSFYAGFLYTEEFKNAEGKAISEAVPGDQVTVNFGAFAPQNGNLGDIYYDSEINAITTQQGIHRHVLKQWNITGVDVSHDTITSFTFTMPENDVTIQAKTELSGTERHRSKM